MSKPRAVYYLILAYQPENRALLEKHFDVVELPDPRADSDSILSTCEICFAPLGFMFDAAKMDRCPRLHTIISNTTGIPHIDADAAGQRNIRVISLKDEQAFLATITPTAEHAVGLMLALIRHTPWAHQSVLDGRWNRRPFGAPAMLSRMRIGIVGYGRLGRLVGRYTGAFGMAVRYFDHLPKTPEPPAQAASSLEALFAWADVISLHLPANQDTRNIIDASLLSRCRTGAYLINTARAELVDERALIAALESGLLAGAASDVLNGEFVPDFNAAGHPLVQYARHHDNLLLTPHIGGSTTDAWSETERRVIEMAIGLQASAQ